MSSADSRLEDMHGKVAIITGAAQGIGKAIAELLLKRGAKVAIADVNQIVGAKTALALEEKYGQQSAKFIHCDVSSEASFSHAFSETKKIFGHMDIVCNNAAIANEETWEQMVAINLTGVFRGTMLALEHMGKHNGGQGGVVINVASAAGVLPMPFGPAYSGVKHGVVGYSRSFGSISPREFGIRINCLCPGFTDTGMLKELKEAEGSQIYAKSLSTKIIDTLGVVQPEVIAEGVLPLILDERLSGATHLVTSEGSHMLDLPKTVPEIVKFAKL